MADLELNNPAFTCGHCRFTTMLIGDWSVEDGRLVFRAAPEPQPGRGPDLESCCEASEVVTFDRIVTHYTDWGEITGADLEALRRTAARAYWGNGAPIPEPHGDIPDAARG